MPATQPQCTRLSRDHEGFDYDGHHEQFTITKISITDIRISKVSIIDLVSINYTTITQGNIESNISRFRSAPFSKNVH